MVRYNGRIFINAFCTDEGNASAIVTPVVAFPGTHVISRLESPKPKPHESALRMNAHGISTGPGSPQLLWWYIWYSTNCSLSKDPTGAKLMYFSVIGS